MKKPALIVIPGTGKYYIKALRLRDSILQHVPWADVVILSNVKGADYYIEDLYFSMAVLLKFKHMLDVVKKTDYQYYFHFDADLTVAQDLPAEDFLKPFVCVRHAAVEGAYFKAREKRSFSRACTVDSESDYLQSGLWGGARQDVIFLCVDCSRMIECDLSRHIIAVWHDESYFNKYVDDAFDGKNPPGILDRKYFVHIGRTSGIDPKYNLPENQFITFNN